MAWGIVVGIAPSSGIWQLELARSSGTVASTNWSTIAILNTEGDVINHTDELPDDNGIRNYRGRHIKTGYTDGAWTTRVSARPIEVYEVPN